MSGSSLPTKLRIALGAQAVFAILLIFYVSQTLLRHLQFDVPQPIADHFVQLIAIIVPPAMLLLSLLALRSPRRAIQASVVAQLLVLLAAARFLAPEVVSAGRGEDVGWAGRLLIIGVLLPLCSSPYPCGRLLLRPCRHAPKCLTTQCGANSSPRQVRCRCCGATLAGNRCGCPTISLLRDPTAAVLVFFPAAARAWFVTTDLWY